MINNNYFHSMNNGDMSSLLLNDELAFDKYDTFEHFGAEDETPLLPLTEFNEANKVYNHLKETKDDFIPKVTSQAIALETPVWINDDSNLNELEDFAVIRSDDKISHDPQGIRESVDTGI